MRIKNDVEFVKKECMSDDSIGWDDQMECRCGEIVSEVKKLKDTEVKCIFSDGDWWSYPPSCLEEEIMLEKGKKYTINGSPDSFEFVEESEHYAIFEDGRVFKKEGNEFVATKPKGPRFLSEKWEVMVDHDIGRVNVLCDAYYVAEITKEGLQLTHHLPRDIGFALDENCAARLVKN